MSQWIKYSFSFAMIASVWSFSFMQGSQSWSGIVYNQSSKSKRHLASVSAKFDLSNVTAIYPEIFEKQNLFDRAYVTESESATHIHLGHISIRSSAINLACENYSHLQLILKASDININGEPLEMKLTSLCKVSKNINFIDPISLPLAEIKKLDSNNFQNKDVFLENSYFLHMSSEWMITQVNFISKSGRSLPKLSIKAMQAFEVNL